MPTKLIARIVHLSCRHPWRVLGAFALLVLASAHYVMQHFAINTDVGKLIDARADWARRDAAITAAFPDRGDSTLAVVCAPAPEFAAQAARELAARLQDQPAWFRAVDLGAGDPFFRRNALLYLAPDQVHDLTTQLLDARPLLDALARDPTLRGLANLLSVTLGAPLLTGQVTLAKMAPLLERSADTVEAVLAGRPAALSWQMLVAADLGGSAGGNTPALVEVRPVLDYNDLLPGAPSSAAIRAAAADLRLPERYGARVALTGPVPLADDEFASLQEGSPLAAAIPALVVLALLWFALRSVRLVLALCLVMLGGLVVTAALGLLMVGALNLISVAFAILFVGLGIDFGIQFGMRFREQRRQIGGTSDALLATARTIALPLTLAATATAFGFLAFLPTAYRGVAELGQIAGVGILCVALPACLTALPALFKLFDPPAAGRPPGYPWLAPLDRLLQAHRQAVLAVTLALVIAGVPLLWRLEFDLDPLHLKNPRSESMATLAALRGSTDIGIDDVQVLAPSLPRALAIAARLQRLPEVAQALTAASLVPDGQPAKLADVATAARVLLPVLAQSTGPPATEAQQAAALRAAAQALHNAALDHPGPGAAQAARLAHGLGALARADAGLRRRAEQALAGPLRLALDSLRLALQPQPVTLATLPARLLRNWIDPAGRALVDVIPKRPPRAPAGASSALLNRFADAVLAVAPDAAGGPISVRHAARLVVAAFIQAAALAVVTIGLLLWIAFRRFDDVLRTMVPLLVSSLVTLEACALLRIGLNFANIIALPLLLGVGVAFKIYYVMAWRAGQQALLAHPLTEAIILSAAATGTAFGSLWLSHHPGTASMGELLVLSLICTLIGAVFFQPVLLGKPRNLPS